MLEFVTQAKDALEELHSLGLAHNDIRLPNICLSKDSMLKLIDFDRTVAAKSKYAANINHFFHAAPKSTAASLDYKQLGLIIYHLKNKPDQPIGSGVLMYFQDSKEHVVAIQI